MKIFLKQDHKGRMMYVRVGTNYKNLVEKKTSYFINNLFTLLILKLLTKKQTDKDRIIKLSQASALAPQAGLVIVFLAYPSKHPIPKHPLQICSSQQLIKYSGVM